MQFFYVDRYPHPVYSAQIMKWTHKTTDPRFAPAYSSWKAMTKRCRDLTNPNYGGRGITVCERWRSFDNFIADMGERPAGMSIERYDNDGNYDPFNCLWATPLEQRQNSRPVLNARQKPKGVSNVLTHGSKRMYHKHKCRCPICVAGFRRRKKQKPSYSNNLGKQAEYLREYRRRKRNQQKEYDL